MDNLKRQQAGEEIDPQKFWEFSVDDLYLKSLEQMHSSWKTIHKGKEFTESTFESSVLSVGNIVDKIEHYSLESKPLLPTVSNVDPLEELRNRVVSKFREKVKSGIIPKDKMQEYQQRIFKELEVITALNAEDYILLCNEITDFCHDNSIEVGFGRGSAGGSLLLFILDVTGIDSIKYKLMFERFLNKNRRPKLIM
jgi:DNA polymerase-3 subunit alpha